jgi:hypothetical protein
MSRILIGDDWFEQLATTSLYEAEYEDLVSEKATILFPEYHIVPFKTMVFTDYEGTKADLALVDKQYRHWWVLEIELAHHPLHGHVLPQVRRLSQASYGEAEADFLCDHSPILARDKVRAMLKGGVPRVLVIANRFDPEWKLALDNLQAALMVIEVFRSGENAHIFRVQGHPLISASNVVSECYLDPILPKLLILDSPGAITVPPGAKISIRFNDSITAWQRMESKDKVWLLPVGLNPLQKNEKYNLLQRDDGSLILVIATKH